LLCSICKKHQRRPKKCIPGRAVWIDIPCSSIRKASLSLHKESDSHKEALLFDAAEAVTGGGIEAGFVREEDVNRSALKASMTLLYFLCKEEIPHTTKHQPLIDVAKSLGVDALNSLEKGNNAKYNSDEHKQELVKLFGETIWESIRLEIQNSVYFSIMIDESTDVSVTCQLILYVRYIKDGKSKTVFAETISIPNGKADTIKDAILTFLHKNQFPLHKLCAFGSDGAAVMVGRKNGVSTQLTNIVPHLISNHCVAHRLALAAAQAASGIRYLDKFKKIIEQLFRFYNYSAVRTASLKEIQVHIYYYCSLILFITKILVSTSIFKL
jgi:hypothetical protein